MRPPFLQSRACPILKTTPHPLRWQGKSGGMMPYWRNTAYLHSWSLSSVPFTTEIATEIHTLVFLPRRRLWIFIGESLLTAVDKYSSASRSLCNCINYLPTVMSSVWYPENNSTYPCKAATRCTVTTYYEVQFPFDIRVRSGIAIPTCWAINTVIFWSGICSTAAKKRSERNY